MRVLIQNSIFYPDVIGGAEISSHLLAVKLHERGHAVDALATSGRRDTPDGLATRPLPGTTGQVYYGASHGLYDLYGPDGPPEPPGIVVRGLHHLAAVRSPRWRRLAGEALDRSRPDVLHTNTIVGMTPMIWEAARERGIPIVHTLRDYHLLCPRTTLLRSSGRECVDTPWPCRALRRLKLDRTGDIAVITAPSTFVLQRHLDAGGFPGARAVRVPNSCETIPDTIPDRRHWTSPRGIYLGQLDTHKGVDVLLAALAQLEQNSAHDLGFDFAGVGPLATRVEAFCATAPARFRYHGQVAGNTKYQLLREASFLVVPSVWNDNFPRTMLDAFAWGLPVIGSDRGGIPEVVGHEREGVIIEPEPSALAAAIRRYAGDPVLRARHGEAARAAASLYTIDKQVDAFLDIYASVVGPAAS